MCRGRQVEYRPGGSPRVAAELQERLRVQGHASGASLEAEPR